MKEKVILVATALMIGIIPISSVAAEAPDTPKKSDIQVVVLPDVAGAKKNRTTGFTNL